MQNVTSKQLTNNKEINQYLSHNTSLIDVVHDGHTFIEFLAHEYDLGKLSHEELERVLYDSRQIDKNFKYYPEFVINQLALLGFESQRILYSNHASAKAFLARTYQCLEELQNDYSSSVRFVAESSLSKLKKLKNATVAIQNIFNMLTHRECVFALDSSSRCALCFNANEYWGEDCLYTRFEISDNDGVCSLSAELKDVTPAYFENTEIAQQFEKYGITCEYKEYDQSMRVYKDDFSLKELEKFVKWLGFELSYGVHDIFDL